jgi:hypothetical protein
MGNAGNIQRLTDGYNWNQGRVMEALNRELTEPEWRFVQKVWDVVETLWPEIKAMERRVNGVEPDKVTPVPLETSAGRLSGGYFPAVYDSRRNLKAEANAGKASDLLETTYTKATTRSSATKERENLVKRPILLQLGVINRHLGEVIHDITHREVIMNADKFLSSERVGRALNASLGPEIRKQFRPWLKSVANQWANDRAGLEGFAGFISKARSNTTAVGMGFRVTTIIAQIGGYSNSFEAVGTRWVSAALAQTVQHPIQTYRFVTERSGEVRYRMDTLDRDINAGIKSLAGQHDLVADAKRFMYHGIGYTDRLVVVPTWIGAYNKALAAGMLEDAAIYEADKAVRQSQGSGAAKDLAAIQRGTGTMGALAKLTTMFYSYMSAFYQRQRTLGRDVGAAISERDARALPGLMARAWWLLVVPPILNEVLAGRGPGDDDDYGVWAFKQVILQMLGPIPVVRDLAKPIWEKVAGDRTFGYQISPMQRAGDTLVNLGGDVGRKVRGEDTKQMTRDTLETVGYTTGVVPGQIAAATQFLVDVGAGDQDPEGFGEWYRGLTTGKAKPPAKK